MMVDTKGSHSAFIHVPNSRAVVYDEWMSQKAVESDNLEQIDINFRPPCLQRMGMAVPDSGSQTQLDCNGSLPFNHAGEIL